MMDAPSLRQQIVDKRKEAEREIIIILRKLHNDTGANVTGISFRKDKFLFEHERDKSLEILLEI